MNESRELKKKNQKQRKIFISDKRSGARRRRFAKHAFENGRKGTFEASVSVALLRSAAIKAAIFFASFSVISFPPVSFE